MSGLPGVTLPVPPLLEPPLLSDFVIDRSAVGVSVSESVAELLPLASDTPAGAVIVAVFDSVPVADGLMLATTVYVTVLFAGILMAVSLIAPVEGVVVKPVAPPVAVALQESLMTPAGIISATLTPLTALGPLLVATIVYVTAVPGTAVPVV